MAGTAVLGLALSACGSSDGSSNASDKSSSTPVLVELGQREQQREVHQRQVQVRPDERQRVQVGGILPLTGNLAYLGPPEIAGVGLAVSDINAAGGVDGTKACHDIQDSGDSTDMSVSTASAGTLIAGKPSVVVGAASSSVSLNVVDTFASNKIVEVSPANTAVDLSGYSPYYFRTAPPDGIQGNALGTLITTDGYKKVAFLVFNDTYGTGLRNAVQKTIEAAGGTSASTAARATATSSRPARRRSRPRSAARSRPSPTRSWSSPSTRPSRSCPSSRRRAGTCPRRTSPTATRRTTARTSRPAPSTGAQGTIPGADPNASLQGPAQRLGGGRRGQAPQRLRLRRRVLRRHHPRRPRGGQGRRHRLADHPEELRGGLRRDRTARSARRTPTASS